MAACQGLNVVQHAKADRPGSKCLESQSLPTWAVSMLTALPAAARASRGCVNCACRQNSRKLLLSGKHEQEASATHKQATAALWYRV